MFLAEDPAALAEAVTALQENLRDLQAEAGRLVQGGRDADLRFELFDAPNFEPRAGSREAEAETTAALAPFSGTVVLHCFSSPGLLPAALERGYYVSFAGNVTYKNAPDLRVAASQVPADRLLAETDCPYLAPQPVRGRPNEPAFVAHTYETLASVRGEDMESQVAANAARVFGL